MGGTDMVSFEIPYESPQNTRILTALETVLERLGKLENRVSHLEHH